MLTKKLDTLIFLLAVLLIPFDNLVIAPSSGWATLAPFVFLFYCIVNYKCCKLNSDGVLLISAIVIISFINYMNNVPVISNIIDSLATMVLGASIYMAFKIYFVIKHNSVNLFLKTILIAYSISFIYGLLQVLNIGIINQIMILIEKRHYSRLSFTFTEPSFISLHLYGVLLPIILIFNKNKRYINKVKLLFCLFIVFSLVFGKSGRFLLDTFIAFVLYFLTYYFKNGLTTWKLFSIGFIFVAGILGFFVLMSNERINSILINGFESDASMAARWFRIQAISNGLIQKPENLIFGFGFSNTFYPFNLGYNYAMINYTNAYLGEIESLANSHGCQFFCGHLRLIADFGVIIYLLILIGLFRKRKNNLLLFLLIMYLYIQFDSFAWYSIWIYLFAFDYKHNMVSKNYTRVSLKNKYYVMNRTFKIRKIQAQKNEVC